MGLKLTPVQSLLKRAESIAAATHDFARKHWQAGVCEFAKKIRFSEEAFHLVLAGGVGVLGGLVNLFFYYAHRIGETTVPAPARPRRRKWRK